MDGHSSMAEIAVGRTPADESRTCWSRPQYSRLLPALILLVGFLLRLLVAAATYLNPDEALHYFLAQQASASLAYRASLTSAHPPLLILMLYGWLALGNSELLLRLPSIVAGTLAGWFAFRWAQLVSTRMAALATLLVLSLSPTLVRLDGEIRQYSLLLLFSAASLYLGQLGLKKSCWWLVFVSSVALCFALLTHYSAILVAAVVALDALIWLSHQPRRKSLLLSWATSQALVIATGLALYLTHVSQLKRGKVTEVFAETYLRKSFFHPGKENVLMFLVRSSYSFFHYLVGQPMVGTLLLAMYLIAVVRLWRGKAECAPRAHARRLAGMLMLPFFLTAGMGVAQLYPYGGTRHDVFLVLFAALGSSIGLMEISQLAPGRKLLGLMAALIFCWIVPHPLGAFIAPHNQALGSMRDAVEYVRGKAAPGSVFLIDHQSAFPFRYYFCRDSVVDFLALSPDFNAFPCGSYRVLSTGPRYWMFTASDFDREFNRALKTYPLPPGSSLWIFQTGWVVNREPGFRTQLAARGWAKDFGQNIFVAIIGVEENRP